VGDGQLLITNAAVVRTRARPRTDNARSRFARNLGLRSAGRVRLVTARSGFRRRGRRAAPHHQRRSRSDTSQAANGQCSVSLRSKPGVGPSGAEGLGSSSTPRVPISLPGAKQLSVAIGRGAAAPRVESGEQLHGHHDSSTVPFAISGASTAFIWGRRHSGSRFRIPGAGALGCANDLRRGCPMGGGCGIGSEL
jgi:hypothetical protein